MVQKAKFKLLNKHWLSEGIQVQDVELTDADGEVVKYVVTDFYSSDGLKIVETNIAVLPDSVDNNSDAEFIDEDSYLGKKILKFLDN